MGPRRIWKAWRKLRARQNLRRRHGRDELPWWRRPRRSARPRPEHRPDDGPGARSAARGDRSSRGAGRRPARRSYLPSNPGLFRLTDNYLDIPQSMTIVTQDLMREQAAFNLRDSLRNVTGISLQAGEGGGGQGDNLSLRGFPARTDIFLDGIRDTGQYNRDVFNLEAVEVLKGPSAVYFGRGSTGGVINQVSKTPQEERFYDGTLSGGNGPLGRGTVDLNQPLGDSMAIRLNALAQYSEPVGRDYVDFLRFGVAPSFAWGVGTPTLFTASYYYYHENNQPDRGIPIVTFPGQIGGPPDVDPSNYYGLVQQDEEKVHLNRGTLTFDHKFNEDIAVHNIFRYQCSDRLSKVTPGGILQPITRRAAAVVDRRHPQPRGPRRERVDPRQPERGPVQVRHVDAQAQARGGRRRRAPDVRPPDAHAHAGAEHVAHESGPLPPGIYTTTNGVRFEADATSVGAYVVDDVQILSWLKLIAGARYDNFNSDITNFNADGTLASSFSRVDQFWSPRAALVVQPTSAQTYYFAWGRSFNPSAEQLNSINVANQGVEPEQDRFVRARRQARLLQQRARRDRRALPDRTRRTRAPSIPSPASPRSTATCAPRASSSGSSAARAGVEHLLRVHVPRHGHPRGVRGGHAGQGPRQCPGPRAVAVDDVRLPPRSGRRAPASSTRAAASATTPTRARCRATCAGTSPARIRSTRTSGSGSTSRT